MVLSSGGVVEGNLANPVTTAGVVGDDHGGHHERDAEAEAWRKSDPATKARTDSVVGQLEASIVKLEAELVAAKASKDAKKIANAEEALAARQAWLKVVLASA